MEGTMRLPAASLVFMLILNAVCWVEGSGLRVGFYAGTCVNAEKIVKDATTARFSQDKTVAAGLLRMYFHDCFVSGCDASLLIKSTPGNSAELDAGPNLTIHGLDHIDAVKAALESACPGVVSCADIIALATRDAVQLSGGVHYDVPTGRRDGRVSLASQVNLPGPSFTVPQATSAFKAKGLSTNDMVTLLGAHTVGVAHCTFFSDRLYSFKGTGKADPTMDPALVAALKQTCPQASTGLGAPTALDQGTKDLFDNSYYKQLLINRGVLQIDQELSLDTTTSALVKSFAGASGAQAANFGTSFGPAMVKLGNTGVLTGTKGEIRKVCSKIN